MKKEEILAQMNEADKVVVQDDGIIDTIEEDKLPKDADGNVDYKAALEAALKEKADVEKASKSAIIQKGNYKKILENIAGSLESKPVSDDKSSNTLSRDEFKIEMFKVKHPELSEEDVITLHQISQATNKTMEQTMETPVFKSYIKELNESKAIEDAIPNFKGRSAILNGEQSNTKAYQDKIISMYPKNMQKYFNKNKDKK